MKIQIMLINYLRKVLGLFSLATKQPNYRIKGIYI